MAVVEPAAPEPVPPPAAPVPGATRRRAAWRSGHALGHRHRRAGRRHRLPVDPRLAAELGLLAADDDGPDHAPTSCCWPSASTSSSATPACSTWATSRSGPSAPTAPAGSCRRSSSNRDFHFLSRGAGRRCRASTSTSGSSASSAASPAAVAGIVIGAPDPAAARRLPGHRDARLRRDHPAGLPEPRRVHERRAAASRRSTRSALGMSCTRSPAAASPRRQHLRPAAALLHHPRSSACCAIYVSLRLRDGKLGRAWIAIREDELAAGAMGIPLMRTKLWAYARRRLLRRRGRRLLRGRPVRGVPDELLLQHLDPHPLHGHPGRDGRTSGASSSARSSSPGSTTRASPSIGTAFNSAAGTSINVPNKSFLIFGIILVVMMLLRPEGLLPAARQKALLHEEIDESTGTAA